MDSFTNNSSISVNQNPGVNPVDLKIGNDNNDRISHNELISAAAHVKNKKKISNSQQQKRKNPSMSKPAPAPPSILRPILLLILLFYTSQHLYSTLLPSSLLWRTAPTSSTSEWMRAATYDSKGGPLYESLFPRPIRGSRQLLIKTVAAGVNPVDWKMIRNPPWPLVSLPAIPGYDFAGVVEEADVGSGYKKGDKVFGMLPTIKRKYGTFAEYVVADEEFLAKMPDGVSFVEAAATPLAALTAIQALADLGPVREGETILIHAGSGGVGTFAIQFAAKLLKMKVFTTSSNKELCESLGAHRVINYKTEKFEQFEYDYVLDTIGGEYLLRGMPKIKKHYVSILNDGWHDYFGTDLLVPFGEGFSTLFFNTRHFLSFGAYPKYTMAIVQTKSKDLQIIAELLRTKTIRVVIDSEFQGLDKGARDLMERSASGRAKGKIVLSV